MGDGVGFGVVGAGVGIAAVLGTRFSGLQGGIVQVTEAVADLVVGQTRRFEELGVGVRSLGATMEFIFKKAGIISFAKSSQDIVRSSSNGIIISFNN